MVHPRAKLLLDTTTRVAEFVKDINSDGSTDRWMVENFDGTLRVNARSFLGMMYASAEWNGEIYLFNDSSENTPIPNFVDKYRA